ncbi:hypothetical protein [Pseudomonas sp. 2995-3]|uniref:hypothetical protein n=1 Tax=Pseudomonas sp. 2995-3 TaxID=1712680 RepID=UPI000C578122|nr:hypothetical protein [Pseudomonas sp. 2995-3]PIB69579.1 hypothetical protein AOA62_04205 [Pseudomonas sp. 2995-3]
MKKINALYDFLISQLDILCSDNIADIERYYEDLSDNDALLFDAYFEKLSLHRDALCAHRDDANDDGHRKVYPGFSELLLEFEDFSSNFQMCPLLEFERIGFVVKVAKKIGDLTTDINDQDVFGGFDFFVSQLGFESKAFCSNVSDLERNVIWFRTCDQESLDALLSKAVNSELLYVILMISSRLDFTRGCDVVVCRADGAVEASQKNVITLLKLYMVSCGEKINKINKYPSRPVNSSVSKFDPSHNYAQFVEVVGILGEYIEREDALSKFLSIYHVVENFMFRAPIVKLERSNNGAMFSIRDFKRLYKGVDVNELGALEYLVRSSFSLIHHVPEPVAVPAVPAVPAVLAVPVAVPAAPVSFGQFAKTSWVGFLATNVQQKNLIDDFLAKVGSSYNGVSFDKFFASLIYRIRCSIVHNKETEYHISSENYFGACCLIFEGYLLPMLEEFVFLLLCEDNSLVWYRSSSIALWDTA